MANKLYILIEPNLISYDKVMTEEAVYDFAYELAFEEDKLALEQHKQSGAVCKDGRSYLEHLIILILESADYKVKVIDEGTFRLKNYWQLVTEICPNREDVKKILELQIAV